MFERDEGVEGIDGTEGVDANTIYDMYTLLTFICCFVTFGVSFIHKKWGDLPLCAFLFLFFASWDTVINEKRRFLRWFHLRKCSTMIDKSKPTKTRSRFNLQQTVSCPVILQTNES